MKSKALIVGFWCVCVCVCVALCPQRVTAFTSSVINNHQTYTFIYTAAAEAITLPAGTYTVQVYGAAGGSGGSNGQTGGRGGYSTGTLIVSSATTYYVYVGGGGTSFGGWNGGGLKGTDTYGSNANIGGGGASDIRTALGNLNTRLIVAGGGGGAGNNTYGGNGGAGGGTTGSPGTDPNNRGTQGGGGTQSAGGALGTCYLCAATVGSLGTGGGGGCDGGGGGGGYYGGAGGCGRNSDDGAGGGGSGYVGGVSSGSMISGANTSSNGRVIITNQANYYPTYGASFVSTTCPNSVYLYTTTNCTATIRNTGLTAWKSPGSSANTLWMRCADSGTYANCAPTSGQVAGPGSSALGANSNITTNNTYSFPFSLSPTTTDTIKFNHGLVWEGVTWIAAPPNLFNKLITVNRTAYAGRYVSDTAPSSVVAGSTFSFTTTCTNIGSTTWDRNAGGIYVRDAMDLGIGDFYTTHPSITSNVATGQSYTFTTTTTAPMSLGNKTLAVGLVWEGTAWMTDRNAACGGGGTWAGYQSRPGANCCIVKTINVTNNAPSITIANPAGNPWRSAVSGYTNITVSGNVTDPDNQAQAIQYSIDGGAWTAGQNLAAGAGTRAYSFAINVGSLAAGSHTIKTRTYDGTAYSGETGTLSFRLDKTAPTVTGVTCNGANCRDQTLFYSATGFTLAYTASDTGGSGICNYSIYLYGPINPSPRVTNQTSGTIAYSALPNGQYTNHGILTDCAGNSYNWSGGGLYPSTILLDTVKPAITLNNTGSTWRNSALATISASDDYVGLNTIRYAWSTGTADPAGITASSCTGGTALSGFPVGQTAAWTSGALTPPSQGVNYLHACTTDRAGNVQKTYAQYNYDTTAPTCTTSGGNTAWTNGNRTITGTCSDTGGSGCAGNISYTYSVNTNITTGGAGTNGAAGSIRDNAGNTTACATNQTVRIDKTAPTCTTAGGNTAWTNDNRTITGTCADIGGSGCAGTNPSYTYSTNTNITTGGPGTSGAAGSVSDAAGNTATCAANQTVKIDKTAPTCTTSGGNTAWTNGDRTITGTCADTGGSGCAGNISYTYSVNTNITNGGAGANGVAGAVADAAGNTAACAANQTVRIDKTTPTCGTFTPASSPWHNSATGTEFTLNGSTDTGGAGLNSTSSGSPQCTTGTNNGDTCNVTIEDNAGNTTTCTSPVNQVDTTAPTCTGWTPASSPWKESGTQTFSLVGCSDTGGAGLVTPESCITGADNGDTCQITVKDNAGNTTPYTSPVNNVDTTAPVCGTWTPTASPWHSSATGTEFTLTGSTDSESGLNSASTGALTCTTDTGDGDTCSVTIEDNVGNTTTCTSPVNQVDTTAPVCGTWTPAPPLPWKNITTASTQDFTLSGSSDETGGSGMAASSYTCTALDTNDATCSATIADNAGNTTICAPSPPNRIDTDLPTVTIDVTGGQIREGTTYLHTPDITVSGEDVTSGFDGVKTVWLTGDGSGLTTIVGGSGGSGSGVGGEDATAVDNCAVALSTVEFYTTDSFVIPDDGTFTLCAESFDVAGNTTISTEIFSLQSPSVIYTQGFNVLHESGEAQNQYLNIYTAEDGESFTLHGTVLADPDAPTNINVCLDFTNVNSEEYPICTTVTTTANSPVDYTFNLPTTDLPTTKDLFISTTMTTTDLNIGDTHTQPVYFILYVGRDVPGIVKPTRQNTYILMRNGRFN